MVSRKEEYEEFEALLALEEDVIEDFNQGLLSEEERDERIAEIYEGK